MAKASKSDDAVDYELNADSTSAPHVTSKGHATPTRKEREAANLRPLVSADRKARNGENRTQLNAAREKARIGAANGEDKYLTARDKGPQRKFVRDYVDARWNVGELMIPFLVIVVLLTFVQESAFITVGTFAMYGFMFVLVLDSIYMGWQLNRKLSAKFGAERVQKGYRWYAAMRAIYLRPWRLPKARVKRGEFPV